MPINHRWQDMIACINLIAPLLSAAIHRAANGGMISWSWLIPHSRIDRFCLCGSWIRCNHHPVESFCELYADFV